MGFSGPHDAPQSDVFTGHSAYFMGPSTGTSYLSKHANVENTCAGCHMELNPDGFHAFRIDPEKRAQVCANCHGSTTGDGLVAQVDSLLGQVDAKIGNAVTLALNAVASPGASTYYVIAVDYGGTNCKSNGASSGATSNVAIDQPALSGSLYSSSGVKLTYASPIVVGNVNGGCYPYTSTNVLYASLSAIVTPSPSSTTTAVPNTNPVVKALWNRNLINNDESHGIHNPSFVLTVLTRTLSALP